MSRWQQLDLRADACDEGLKTVTPARARLHDDGHSVYRAHRLIRPEVSDDAVAVICGDGHDRLAADRPFAGALVDLADGPGDGGLQVLGVHLHLDLVDPR